MIFKNHVRKFSKKEPDSQLEEEKYDSSCTENMQKSHESSDLSLSVYEQERSAMKQISERIGKHQTLPDINHYIN